jgi:hypothetical protein
MQSFRRRRVKDARAGELATRFIREFLDTLPGEKEDPRYESDLATIY